MMEALELLSERVHAAGSFQGGGVLRLLGAPQMDDLTLIVREAVQNSWDARLPENSAGTVDFRIRIFTLNQSQKAALRGLFADTPREGSPLRDVLNRESILVAEIRDEGTAGLNGPTRADRSETGPRNFVNFIRNIGAPQGREDSGGTYGFGKGSYYRVSEAHTILVHTRCVTSHGTESRLIAAAVDEPFEVAGIPFTGRHFWGDQRDAGSYVEPVTGQRADQIAASLGIGVPEGLTGTSIMAIGFRTGLDAASEEGATSRNPRSAAEHAAHQLLWQCWPKLVQRNGLLPMRFFVEYEGEPVKVPDVTEAPALKALGEALSHIHSGHPDVVHVRSLRPRKELGSLAFRDFSAPVPDRGFGTEASAGFQVPTHHVALMRTPELVVTYLPGPASDKEDHGWVGVFLADPDVDRSFAAAEPPSHDDWVKAQVEDKGQRRDVSVALREIDAATKARFSPVTVKRQSTAFSVSALASALGEVFRMPGLDSSRPTVQKTAGNGGGHGRGRKVRQISSGLRMIGGVPAHVVRLDADQMRTCHGVDARVGVAVDDGSTESEGPAGSSTPVIIGWLVDGGLIETASRLGTIPDGEVFELAIERQPDVVPVVTVTMTEAPS